VCVCHSLVTVRNLVSLKLCVQSESVTSPVAVLTALLSSPMVICLLGAWVTMAGWVMVTMLLNCDPNRFHYTTVLFVLLCPL